METEVRSEKVLKNNNGFKPSSCLNKKCICCNPSPPILSPKIIKNLSVQFYGLEEEEVSDEALGHKRKKAAPGAKKSNLSQARPTGRKAELQNDVQINSIADE